MEGGGSGVPTPFTATAALGVAGSFEWTLNVPLCGPGDLQSAGHGTAKRDI